MEKAGRRVNTMQKNCVQMYDDAKILVETIPGIEGGENKGEQWGWG
jgi:hypothetical protein